MHAKDVGGVDGQRAVDKDLDVGNVAAGIQLVERVDKFLRAADGKGRNDDLAALAHGLVDHIAQLLAGVGVVSVQAVAVGALHDHDIGFRKHLRGAEDWALGAADIAAKDDPPLLAGA